MLGNMIAHNSYGASAEKKRRAAMVEGLWITKEEAKQSHDAYMKALAGVDAYTKSLEDEWSRTGVITSVYGRPLECPPNLKKDLKSRMIQSSGHEMLMTLLCHIDELRKERKVIMSPWDVDIHDATIWEAPISQGDAPKLIIEEALRRLNVELNPTIPLSGSVDVVRNFWDIKKE
jgi:DNA polymerase I-like protein with 3'-5' exonuclease and polymerase domains